MYSENLLCAAFAWLLAINTLCSLTKASLQHLEPYSNHNRIARPSTTTICEQSQNIRTKSEQLMRRKEKWNEIERKRKRTSSHKIPVHLYQDNGLENKIKNRKPSCSRILKKNWLKFYANIVRKIDTHARFMYIVHIHVKKLKRTRNENKNKISTKANDNYSEGFFPLALFLSFSQSSSP